MAWLVITVAFGFILCYISYVLFWRSGSASTGNNINDFIKAPSNSDYNLAPEKRDCQHLERAYTELGKQVLIIFGSEYGAAEEVARKMKSRLLRLSSDALAFYWQPRVLNAKDYAQAELNKEQVLLVVMSTSGDGVPPTDARKFVDYLDKCEPTLAHLKCAVLALGDSSYPHFCRAGITVDRRLHELGAARILPRTDVDAEDWSVIIAWFEQIVASMQSPDLVVEPRLDYLQPVVSEPLDNNDGYGRLKPFIAVLSVKKQLAKTSAADDKEIIHFEFDISGSNMSWSPGDALGIYPKNNPADVRAVLKSAALCDTHEVSTPSWAYDKSSEVLTLYEALEKYYDLKTVGPDLLRLLSAVYTGSAGARSMQHLLEAGESKALNAYCSCREVSDVLREASVGLQIKELPAERLLGCLRPLAPRYYSISSSQTVAPTVVCCTIAVLRYETMCRQRSGVCSTFLQDRCAIGDRCPVFVSYNYDFRLPESDDTSMIMIGPGTGIAPFMAFLQEKAARQSKSKSILYYGCRHSDKDFIYREMLEKWQSDGVVDLRLAFSRSSEQPFGSKTYVQHLLAQDSALVWQILQNNGNIYVCGDARAMAPDVHRTLLSIVEKEGNFSSVHAADYLDRLLQLRRYQRDVWVT